jgi:hypothetical protein
MNKVSKENVKIADFARIEAMTGVMCYAVTVWKNGCCSYVSDKYGIMLFDNHLEAFKAVFKVRTDLPFRQYPTSTPRLPVLSPPLPPEPAGTFNRLPSNHCYF